MPAAPQLRGTRITLRRRPAFRYSLPAAFRAVAESPRSSSRADATGRPPLFARSFVVFTPSTLLARHHNGESTTGVNLVRPFFRFPLVRVRALDNARVIRRETNKILHRCRVTSRKRARHATAIPRSRLARKWPLQRKDRHSTPAWNSGPPVVDQKAGSAPVMRLVITDHHDSPIRGVLDILDFSAFFC